MTALKGAIDAEIHRGVTNKYETKWSGLSHETRISAVVRPGP